MQRHSRLLGLISVAQKIAKYCAYSPFYGYGVTFLHLYFNNAFLLKSKHFPLTEKSPCRSTSWKFIRCKKAQKNPICCVLQQITSSYNQFLVAWVSHVQRQAGLPAYRSCKTLSAKHTRITVTSSCRIFTCFPFHLHGSYQQHPIPSIKQLRWATTCRHLPPH